MGAGITRLQELSYAILSADPGAFYEVYGSVVGWVGRFGKRVLVHGRLPHAPAGDELHSLGDSLYTRYDAGDAADPKEKRETELRRRTIVPPMPATRRLRSVWRAPLGSTLVETTLAGGRQTLRRPAFH